MALCIHQTVFYNFFFTVEHEVDNIVFLLPIGESRVRKVSNLPKVKQPLSWTVRVGDPFYLAPKLVFNHCSMHTRHSA